MIRAAVYCRVSTDREDQANSFEAQQRYFRKYIESRPDWELAGIYADGGISGTGTRKRTQFQRMIEDARRGEFRLILTKEVSRFSRNILDTIAYTRELKALGVGVLFVNDGISTLEPDAELRLSIMGSIAQEESRRTSSRVKWGQTRQMERGVVFGTSMLGYSVKDGKMTVEPEGAELVRLIFRKYAVEKKGCSVIARELREAGYRTSRGNTEWSASHIAGILKNEKYAGDLVQKKTYTPDYLSHAKRYNHGEEALIRITGHHEAIIERALWEQAQEERKKRSRSMTAGEGYSVRYAFSGKIRCGVCGAGFVSRRKYRRDGSFYQKWSCSRAVRKGDCGIGIMLRDEAAAEMVKAALKTLRPDTAEVIETVAALAEEAAADGARETAESAERLRSAAERTQAKRERALDAFLAGDITKEELRNLTGRYDAELSGLRGRMDALKEREHGRQRFSENIRSELAAILRGETGTDLFCRNLTERITVYPGRRAELRLLALPQKWVFSAESGGHPGEKGGAEKETERTYS